MALTFIFSIGRSLYVPPPPPPNQALMITYRRNFDIARLARIYSGVAGDALRSLKAASLCLNTRTAGKATRRHAGRKYHDSIQ